MAHHRSLAPRPSLGSDAGFTLIELLVVILIIGILAAIAIPSFLNQRIKGQDACAINMSKQMQTAIKTVQVDQGNYTGATVGTLTVIESSIQGGQCGVGSTVSLGATANGTTGGCTGTAATGTTFCVAATSVSGTTFSIVEDPSTTPTVRRLCGPTSNRGGCKSANQW